MHLIRDFSNTLYRWKAIVKEERWSSFANLTKVDWFKWNMKNEASKNFTKKVYWMILFGHICWDIWVDWCKKAFNGDPTQSHPIAHSSFLKACLDLDLHNMARFLSYDGNVQSIILWEELMLLSWKSIGLFLVIEVVGVEVPFGISKEFGFEILVVNLLMYHLRLRSFSLSSMDLPYAGIVVCALWMFIVIVLKLLCLLSKVLMSPTF